MNVKRITSRSNETFRELVACLEPKGIRKHGICLLSGRKLVEERLAAREDDVISTIVAEGMALPECAPAHRVLSLTSELFQELDIFGTKAPLLALRTPQLDLWRQEAPARGLEILCALGEPSNVGALVRSAAAFGASRLVLLKESATPFHPKALRAAAGTTWKIKIRSGPSIRDLRSDPSLLALDMRGIDLGSYSWPKDARLLLGQEGPGLPDGMAAQRLRIPMNHGIESLNAPIAASIALFSYRTRYPLQIRN